MFSLYSGRLRAGADDSGTKLRDTSFSDGLVLGSKLLLYML